MRQFYLKFPIFQSVTGKLSWTHYAELLGVSDDTARDFYIKQCEIENWSVRELKRQINSSLFERLALSKDKKGILELAKEGITIDLHHQNLFLPADKRVHIFQYPGVGFRPGEIGNFSAGTGIVAAVINQIEVITFFGIVAESYDIYPDLKNVYVEN